MSPTSASRVKASSEQYSLLICKSIPWEIRVQTPFFIHSGFCALEIETIQCTHECDKVEYF